MLKKKSSVLKKKTTVYFFACIFYVWYHEYMRIAVLKKSIAAVLHSALFIRTPGRDNSLDHLLISYFYATVNYL